METFLLVLLFTVLGLCFLRNIDYKEVKKELLECKEWISVDDELPPPSNDDSGFGDIHSKIVLVKDELGNYDVKKYDHLAKCWLGSRNVNTKFWKYIK